MSMLKKLCQRSLIPVEERKELVEKLEQIGQQKPNAEKQRREVEEKEESQNKMDDDDDKIESLAQEHSAHDVGKEKARNMTQCNDT